MNLNRRKFFGFLSAAAAVALVPLKHIAPVTYAAMVTCVLSNRSKEIAANITQNNVLLEALLKRK